MVVIDRGKAWSKAGHSARAPKNFKIFKKILALCHELIKAPRAYQSLTKRNKSQQSLSQCVGKLNRAWFKAGTPVFKVCHHLTRFVKMSQDLLRSGMKIWHVVRRFHHQTLTRFVTLWWRTLMLWEAFVTLGKLPDALRYPPPVIIPIT